MVGIQSPNPHHHSAFDLHKERLALMMNFKRLIRSGETLCQISRFTLADQVLTHLLVTSDVSFELVAAEDVLPARTVLRKIILERYALQLSTAPSKNSIIFANNIENGEPVLSQWPQDALVQYILDHEVPVDPTDMPGHERLAA